MLKKTPLLQMSTQRSRSDVPGARSTSPVGRSSPFPHPRLPPTGCPVALDSNPFAPPHRERREDPFSEENY